MPNPERLALITGIDTYPDAPLLCCANDAQQIAAALEMEQYGFPTQLLLDANATRRNILRELAAIESQPPRTFLFYFSGHGCVTSLGTYLVTVDAEPFSEGLELTILARFLDNIGRKGSTGVVVLDCCHSGTMFPWPDSRLLRPQEIESSIPSLGKSRAVLAACRPDEFAYEDSTTGNGLFTSHLLNGLLGDAADRHGCVTISGLYEHVCHPFERIAKQTPVFRADIEGRVVLGRGFPPRTNGDLNQLETSQIVNKARAFLDEYIASTNVPLQEWKDNGFRAACQSLEPILRWFRRQASTHPVLLRDTTFAELHSSARSRLAQLGNVDAGVLFMGRRFTRRLGDGSFGHVWKLVAETSTERPLAYKVYHPHELNVAEKIARFERGHRAMKKLDHPNIVRVGEYTQCPIGFFMDYIDGPNLRELGQGLDEPADKVRLLITVAETMRHAHGREVIHRDIKPENIVAEYDVSTGVWRPYLTDFDLAWFSTATQFTKDAIGTTFYAAPEQLANPSSRSAHATTVDVYSFGQLLYFLATGSDPVPLGLADNSRALRQVLSGWGSELAARRLLELYRDCSEANPADRVANFTIVVDRLGDTLQAIREIASTQDLDSPRFLEEIAYSLVGLAPEEKSQPGEFFSVSGRTIVSLHIARESPGRCKVVARLAPSDRLSLEGVTNDRARSILNSRIDEAIRGMQRVRRRSGGHGVYEVFLDFDPVAKNSTGIQACRAALVRAIDAIERQ